MVCGYFTLEGKHNRLCPKHPGQPVLQCEVGQGDAVRLAEQRPQDKKTAHSLSCHRRESSVEVLDGSRGYLEQLNPELLAGGLDSLHCQRMRGCRGVPEHADPLRLRQGFCQNLQFLGDEIGVASTDP
jgi:hypothetical protein